jgi:CrcB protein
MSLVTSVAWVAIGGAIGAVLRYLATLAFAGGALALPWGTLVANLAGCLAIGGITELVTRDVLVSPEARLLLATGLCGGFTTMSSFVYELAGLYREGALALAGSYLVATLAGSAACFVLGVFAVQLIWRA